MAVPTRTVLALLAASTLGLSACGTERTVHAGDTSAGASPTPAAAATGISTDLARKPAIPPAAGAAPTRLVVKDVVRGTGAAVAAGQTATVQYVGAAYATGKQFDASWDRGQPLPFQLGSGMVIRGWDEGVVGMRVGGRRELIIPPALGYGAQGSPPAIAPNETLAFVIDLKAISKTPTGG